MIRIPVKIFSNRRGGQPVHTQAEALAVSRVGALLRAPLSPELGTLIEVLNSMNEEVQEFRVVRVAKAREDGLFELGIEMLFPRSNFWGIRFPHETSPA